MSTATSGCVTVGYLDGVTRTGTAVLRPTAGPDDSAWVPLGAGDFNADEQMDLVWRNSASGRVILGFMQGAAPTGTAAIWGN